MITFIYSYLFLFSMLIRLAQEKDIPAILDLTSSSTVSRSSLNSGFVEFPLPSKEEYKDRICGNPYFYVVEDKGIVIAFLAGYSSEKIFSLWIEDFIIQSFPSEKYIYLEQCCVLPSFRKRGIASEIFSRLFLDLTPTDYSFAYAATSIQNTAALALLSRHSFSFVKEVSSSTGLLFYLYSRKI